ncbi:hypothetical protein BLS_005826 [Venturia inaequalis]|uniref:Uncharacterized protein n=1 Tax=Venturia inaequalis TaxID=5025 RepID=A0A8H3VLY0_VENIN|nr:hypothetical protein EG328_005464 [Venturia inaequalis]KAE9982577.1 hypothetical protein BLS_005826 [Venturia inaequalis]KAE9991265.1 hypothetical protein EG327_000210 [Venturia inaequalis]
MDPVLSEAVNDASKERLRFVLRDILKKFPYTITTAAEHLVAAVPDITKAKAKRSLPDNENEWPFKRRKRYDFCVQCEGEFDVNDNSVESCMWHKGELDIDDDASVWDDWEDRRDGIQDSEESRKEHPEGFSWDCCQRHGDGGFGCKRGPHRNERERFEYEQTRGDETDDDVDEEGYAEGEQEDSDDDDS